LPATLGRREVRDGLGTPGFRTRQLTRATTRLDPEGYRVADLAELSCQRRPVATSRAQRKPTMPMEGLPGQMLSGVLKELPVLACVYTRVRLVSGASATRPHLAVERSSFLEARRWLSAPNPGRP
jgi:hypothetical protein